MSLRNLLVEPEIRSTLFFSIHVVGIILVLVFVQSWPLSIIWTGAYVVAAVFILRRLASGHLYIPTKKLHGQTVIVTGAATGIGRVCALRFAALGARVIIGVRGQERADRIAKELSDESRGGTVIGYDLDLSKLASVKKFAERIDRVDILLNNAGTVESSFEMTVDGIESTFATNHVGHFYLTKLLVPLLTNGRVVNVSSLAHYFATPSKVDYSFSSLRNHYNNMTAYGFSKLVQIYHASELTRRHGIKAYSLHPGTIVKTGLQKRQLLINRLIIQCFTFIGKTVEEGAMTSLYCALSDDAKPGQFHSDCQVRQPSQLALDADRAVECWNESEKLVEEKTK